MDTTFPVLHILLIMEHWHSSHWKVRSVSPLSTPTLGKIYASTNRVWQKWCTWLSRLAHERWYSILSVCRNSCFGALSYHVRSLTILKLPCSEEAQAVRRGPAEVPADNQNQVPDMGVKRPPNGSSSQPLSIFNVPDIVEQRWETVFSPNFSPTESGSVIK